MNGVKAKYQPLENFEASSVRLFAGLSGRDFKIVNALRMVAQRAASSVVDRADSTFDRVDRVDRTDRNQPEATRTGAKGATPDHAQRERRQSASASTAPIVHKLLKSGDSHGFVPFDRRWRA